MEDTIIIATAHPVVEPHVVPEEFERGVAKALYFSGVLVGIEVKDQPKTLPVDTTLFRLCEGFAPMDILDMLYKDDTRDAEE
jgi:hypothetical protein